MCPGSVSEIEKLTFLELIDDTVELSKLFFANKFEECAQKFKDKRDISMYHHFGQCLLTTIQGILTFDKNVMGEAIDEIEICLAVYTKKYLKQKSGFFSSKNYDQYSDEEIHAELSYNILLNLSSLVNVVYDQSFTGFLKSAYRITNAYMGYKECLKILETRNCWSHPRLREHFEALLKHFLGIIEIVIAYMPPKLSKLLEFIGFSGQLETGMQYLETSFYIKNTFGNLASSVVLMFLNTFAEYFYGLGNLNIQLMKDIHANCVSNFPDSAYSAMSEAALQTTDCKFEEVVNTLQQFMDTAEEQPQYIQFVMCWLKSWNYAFLCDWNKAAENMKSLLNCPWAPAMFHYIYGTFLFAAKSSKDSDDIVDRVALVFEKVPSLRLKIGGRKLFHDDFVVHRAQKYFSSSRKHFLPTYELFYIWNYFSLISKNKKSMESILQDIKLKLESIEDVNSMYDDYTMLLFLKAVVLKYSSEEDEAKKIFTQIIQNGKKLHEDNIVLAHSMYEVALMCRDKGNTAECREWLKKAKKNQHGYLTERLLKFRIDLLLNHVDWKCNDFIDTSKADFEETEKTQL